MEDMWGVVCPSDSLVCSRPREGLEFTSEFSLFEHRRLSRLWTELQTDLAHAISYELVSAYGCYLLLVVGATALHRLPSFGYVKTPAFALGMEPVQATEADGIHGAGSIDDPHILTCAAVTATCTCQQLRFENARACSLEPP